MSDEGRRRLAGPTRIGVAAALAVLLVDQATKSLAIAGLDDGPVDLVWTLRLKLHFNSGSAFSFAPGRGGLFSLLGLVVVVVLARSIRGHPGVLPRLALGLVAGGAFGNLGDRIFRAGDGFLGGRVVDFIDLQWWPIFNVADIAVVCGAGLFLLATAREPAPQPVP